MTAPTVTSIQNQINARAYDAIASTAVHYPHAAKVLSIVAAIGLVVEHIFLGPASCIEHVVRTGMNLRNYYIENDADRKEQYYALFTRHLQCAGWSLIIETIIGPFIGLDQSVRILKALLESPLKTAKIHAADLRLNEFIKTHDRSGLKEDYAEAACERFKKLVEDAGTNEAAASWHFLDSPEKVEQLEREIETKERLFQIQDQRYNKLYASLPDYSVITFYEQQSTLNRAWQKFKKEFIPATLEKAEVLALDTFL